MTTPAPDTSDLRDTVASSLLKIVRDGVPVFGKDEDGNPVLVGTVPAAASYFAVAREFIKDHPPQTHAMVTGGVGMLDKHLKRVLPFGPKAVEG